MVAKNGRSRFISAALAKPQMRASASLRWTTLPAMSKTTTPSAIALRMASSCARLFPVAPAASVPLPCPESRAVRQGAKRSIAFSMARLNARALSEPRSTHSMAPARHAARSSSRPSAGETGRTTTGQAGTGRSSRSAASTSSASTAGGSWASSTQSGTTSPVATACTPAAPVAASTSA